MTVKTTLAELKALGDEKVRKHNTKWGASDNQFGVKLGDIRKMAKKIKTDHKLAMGLWKTGNADARFLAMLVMKPQQLNADEMDAMVRSVTFTRVMDWLISYVLKDHPDKETLRQSWMTTDHVMAARAGWALTASRVAKGADGLDLGALLDRIEAEMPSVSPDVQWTMNMCLVETGIHFEQHRKRALAIGEALGVFRDYPTTKGCTSPFAPIWIREMVKRQG